MRATSHLRGTRSRSGQVSADRQSSKPSLSRMVQPGPERGRCRACPVGSCHGNFALHWRLRPLASSRLRTQASSLPETVGPILHGRRTGRTVHCAVDAVRDRRTEPFTRQRAGRGSASCTARIVRPMHGPGRSLHCAAGPQRADTATQGGTALRGRSSARWARCAFGALCACSRCAAQPAHSTVGVLYCRCAAR